MKRPDRMTESFVAVSDTVLYQPPGDVPPRAAIVTHVDPITPLRYVDLAVLEPHGLIFLEHVCCSSDDKPRAFSWTWARP